MTRLPPFTLLLGLLPSLLGTLACGPDDDSSDPIFCAVPLDGSPRRGPADAPVTLVEFADFECPFCRSAESTVTALLAERPTEVALVFKHAPNGYHAHALPAALATVCADEQGRFWELHDALLAPGAALDDAALETHAESVGLELETWRTCLDSDAAYLTVEADLELAVNAGITATPTFFVNGRALVGALPLDTLRAAVDEAAAAVDASGLSGPDYYAEQQQRPCR
jgi:protein-disulfide isomerase